MDAAARIAAALDPLLTANGFSEAQGGADPDGDRRVILWCAAYADVRDRLPWLPQAHAQEDGPAHACVDLELELRGGRIVSVELERITLADTLSAVGLADASADARGLDGDLGTALPVLEGLLSALLSPPAGARP